MLGGEKEAGHDEGVVSDVKNDAGGKASGNAARQRKHHAHHQNQAHMIPGMPVFRNMETGKQEGRDHHGKAQSHGAFHDGKEQAAKNHSSTTGATLIANAPMA